MDYERYQQLHTITLLREILRKWVIQGAVDDTPPNAKSRVDGDVTA